MSPLPLDENCRQRATCTLAEAIDGLIERLALQKHLSAQRRNGLHAMIARIQALAGMHAS